jgi:hypothetical protein
MPDSVGRTLRRQIAERAGGRCEYCLTPEWILLAGCEVDHVISRKHGGITDPSNLAFSCVRCNRAKGSDIGSLIPGTGQYCRMFNPRIDRWEDHFGLEGSHLIARTDIAEITVRLLRLNDPERMAERALLQQIGEYPK